MSRIESKSTPTLRVAPSRTYSEKKEKVRLVTDDFFDVTKAPGIALGFLDGTNKLDEYRKLEKPVDQKGIQFEGGETKIETVPNPDSPDGFWDPLQFMPRFLFDPAEDALPVAPDFDGDGDIENNASKTPNGKGTYQDGVIGGRQNLSGGFAVTKKGEYTVLTYSFYFPHNKAGDYHTKDWSIAQVYLKPGKDGKLKPEALYTSWHHGGMLTSWDQLKKDAQGNPVIRVCLGSHALQPLGKKETIPKKGLQLRGDGQAEWNGTPVNQRLSLDTFQQNVVADRWLRPDTDAFDLRMKVMKYGSVGFDPLMPEVFQKQGGLKKEAIEVAKTGLAKLGDAIKDKVSAAAKSLKGFFDRL
ncbi:MAG: hypothetical protein ACM3YO_05725 [Bacteroidota bacterium]